MFSMTLDCLYCANQLAVDGYRRRSTPRSITSPMAAVPQGIRHCCGVVLPLFALLWRRVNVVAMSPSVSAHLRAGTLLLPPSAGQTLAVSTCTAHRHGCGARADEPDPDDGEQEGPLRTGEGKVGDTLLRVAH